LYFQKVTLRLSYRKPATEADFGTYIACILKQLKTTIMENTFETEESTMPVEMTEETTTTGIELDEETIDEDATEEDDDIVVEEEEAAGDIAGEE
jgi:hypothetical protein